MRVTPRFARIGSTDARCKESKVAKLPRTVIARIGAVLAVILGGTALAIPPATANSCADGCRAAHNQCRIANKGSPSCDAALTRCLSGCTGKK